MKEAPVDGEGAVVTHDQAPVVPQPADGALDDPAPSVSPESSSVLSRWPSPIPAMRRDQLDSTLRQSPSQRIAVITASGDHSRGLPPPSYADRIKRRFREPDFRRGCRVKVVSQRNTLAVDHHHPLRAFPPGGFCPLRRPLFGWGKTAVQERFAPLQLLAFVQLLRNARQISSQTSCSSQSRSRRQHVEGCGNSSGKSCQRAPLRRIHKMPSSTLRSLAGGRPPCGRLGRFGSRGRIFSHCASVNSRPYRGIGPPSGAALPSYRHWEKPTMVSSTPCTQFCNWF